MHSPLFASNPLPLSLLLLWLTVPGIWLGAGTLADLLVANRTAARALRPAVALSAWIFAVQLASVATHSFWIGLPVGMVGLCVAGFVLWFSQRRTAATDADANGTIMRLPRGMWPGMALTTVPISVLAFGGYFHDTVAPNGHMSFVAQLQNGSFAPRYLGYSQIPLRYHYGFDLVCAGLTALTRISIPTAIRVTTIFGWAYSWCLAWLLGERLTGRRDGGLWTAIAAMLGSGLVAFLAPFLHGISWESRLTGFYTFGTGTYLNPPFVSYIFQHPFSLGFPLAFAVLLACVKKGDRHLAAARKEGAEPSVARSQSPFSTHGGSSSDWLIGLILAALSLTQSVLFVTLAATLAFTEIVVRRRWSFAAVLAAAFAAAWCMGGMLFTRVPNSAPSGMHFAFWPITVSSEHAGEPVWHWSLRVLAWHLVTFGFLLPLGIWGLWLVRQLRLALLLLIAGGLAVRLCLDYEYTWDMVKFSTVAAWALGIAAGAALAQIATLRGIAGRMVLTAAVVGIAFSSLVWIAGVAWILHTGRGPSTFIARPVELGRDDLQSLAWLRTNVRPDELVYRLPSVSPGYMQWGGLSATPEKIDYAGSFGVRPEIVHQRDEVIDHLPAELAPYKAIGVRWFVVGPDDPRMLRIVQNWERDGSVVNEATFGELRIDEVVQK